MPTFDPSAPRSPNKFLGIAVTVPQVATEGDTLSANMAKFVNKQLGTVVGNAFAGSIRKQLEAKNTSNAEAFKAGTYTGETVSDAKGKVIGPKPATIADLGPVDWQAQFDTAFTSYTPGVSQRGGGGTGSPSKDPVEAMAIQFASAKLKAMIAAKGLKVSAFYAKAANGGQSKWAELLANLMTKEGDNFRAQAKAQIDSMSSVDDSDILAGLEVPAPAAA